MLTTNQRLDKLSAARIDFAARNMLEPVSSPSAENPVRDTEVELDGDNDDPVVDGERVLGEVLLAKYPSKFSCKTSLITELTLTHSTV